MDVVKHILRHVKKTTNYGIFFKTRATLTLSAFTDTDYLGCVETRQSTRGYVFNLANGDISWSSKSQSTVSDSTTEAEYKALNDVSKEVVYLRRLLSELGVSPATTALDLASHNEAKYHDLIHASSPIQQNTAKYWSTLGQPRFH